MIAWLLVLLPLAGLPLLLLPAVRARAELVLVGAAVLVAVAALWTTMAGQEPPVGGWLRRDAMARLFTAVIDPVFAGIALHTWLRVHQAPDLRAGMATFVALALPFLAAVNLVVQANHVDVAWLALEASTLAAAPLVARAGTRAARQASWQYLLFSCVGLGLVLAGLLCVQRGQPVGGAGGPWFDQPDTLAVAATSTWGRLGIGLVLLGLASKLGLAPMYTWLPAAYDEAPTSVAAMLGAVQFNAAFVVLLRLVGAWRPVHGELITGVLVTLGLMSMLVATFSIIATANLRRLIAYASVHHGGVLAIGVGLGRPAAYGVLLYALSNALVKAILFLTAGQIHRWYGTKDTRRIRGLIRGLPYSGLLLMLGTFALLGFPPFGSFFGELLILSALGESGRTLVFAAFCVLLAVAFVATGRTVFPMIWGASELPRTLPRQSLVGASPKLLFVAALVVLGLWIPESTDALLRQVAGGGR